MVSNDLSNDNCSVMDVIKVKLQVYNWIGNFSWISVSNKWFKFELPFQKLIK